MNVRGSLLFSRTLANAFQTSPRQSFLGLYRLGTCTASPPFALNRFIHTPHPRASPLASVASYSSAVQKPTWARLPSILQFVSNQVRSATHRSSRISRISSNSPRPDPRRPFQSGPEGPWRQFRQKLNALPNPVLLWGVLALNGLVFATWHLATIKYQSTGNPSFYIWMRNNFTVSMNNIRSGRIWTVLTSCFSHEDLGHFFVNAFTYYFMAPTVMSILGNTSFLALYLGGGLISSLTSVVFHQAQGNNPNYSSHGASGAIYAVISFFACVAPRAKFYLFAVLPMPAWAFVTGIFLWDSYSALQNKRAGTDTAGHVGGILAGIAYYLRLRFRF